MKKYKNYFIAAAILILGIFIGNIGSGSKSGTDSENTDHVHGTEDEASVWTCSMHPQIRMNEEGSCPICGMDLIPLDKSNTSSEELSDDEILFTQEAMQLANIQTSVVSKSNATKNVRLLGTVKPDERRQYSQVSHLPGRIERLYLNFTGEKVQKGQKIVRLYSPELISAQKELFEAIKSKEVYPQLYKASRNKLKLWKITDAQIDAIINAGKVQEQIDILSDYSGYVMKRNVELGDHVMSGMKLFNIANIDVVWVMFDAYETDIPWIKKGDVVNFTMQAVPGKLYNGKVTYIDPFVSAESRVAKVRVEMKNPKHQLLPEMFANGIIESTMAGIENALLIPKSAVLWTGKRAVVYVKVPHERIISFVYREVILGADLGEAYIVEKGLENGEIIATNGVFRIDASAQLLGQKSMMNPTGAKGNAGGMANMPGMKMDNDKSSGSGEMDEEGTMIMIDKTKIDINFQKQLGLVVEDYIVLKDAMVVEDVNKAISQTGKMENSLKNVDMNLLLGDAHNVWMKNLSSITKNLKIIKNNKNIEEQRKAFARLSSELTELIDNLGIHTANSKPLYLEYCSMANNNQGAHWLSFDEEIRNPYFGDKMLQCGEVVKSF